MFAFPTFLLGEAYSRKKDVHDQFGGNRQSGIAPSAKVPAIFLFTGDSGLKFGYRDSSDVLASDYCDYTGEGQSGDMAFTAGNKAVRDHVHDGKALHLFKALGKSRPYLYVGEFALASYSRQKGLDRDQQDRQIIVFHLVRVHRDHVEEASFPSKEVVAIQPSPSIAEAKAKALAACEPKSGMEGRQALVSYFQRSQAVRQYALLRAGGICEACASPAPFSNTVGEPYLEVHHTTRLSDGGVDHPRNVAALCPTCHREIHFGAEGMLKNDRLRASLQRIEKNG